MFDFLSHNTGVDTGVNTVRPSPLEFLYFYFYFILFIYIFIYGAWPGDRDNVHGQTTTSAINAYLTYRPTAGQQNTWLAPQWTAENIAKRISHFSLSCLTSYFHVTGTIDCLASPATSAIVNIDVPTYNAVHRPYILTPPQQTPYPQPLTPYRTCTAILPASASSSSIACCSLTSLFAVCLWSVCFNSRGMYSLCLLVISNSYFFHYLVINV